MFWAERPVTSLLTDAHVSHTYPLLPLTSFNESQSLINFLKNLPRFHTNVLQTDGSTHFIQEIAQFCCSIVVVMGSVSQGLIKLSCAGEKEKERERQEGRSERTDGSARSVSDEDK